MRLSCEWLQVGVFSWRIMDIFALCGIIRDSRDCQSGIRDDETVPGRAARKYGL